MRRNYNETLEEALKNPAYIAIGSGVCLVIVILFCVIVCFKYCHRYAPRQALRARTPLMPQ